jgi:RNA polymerase sigma-70 factor (ECF subfamily)
MTAAPVEVTEVTSVSQRQLLRAARAGDRRAFGELVRLKIPGSFRLAAGILGNEPDAADAVQNAFVAAWRELPRVSDLDGFDAWLRRILVNECRMQLRQTGRRSAVPNDSEGLGALVSSAPAMSARVEVLNVLERAFEQLEPDDRILVALQLLENRSLSEIADALHMPLGTAKVRLHEARQALHQELGTGA